MAAAYYEGFPHQLITPGLTEEIQRLEREQGYEAGLAKFRQAVGNDPWFQNASPSESGFTRLESEFLNLITEENVVSVPGDDSGLA